MSADYGPAILDLAIQPNGTKNWFNGYTAAHRKFLIIHGTAGGASAAAIAAYFRTGPHSTHYVIGKDGEVRQCVAENMSAWGNAPYKAGSGDTWWQALEQAVGNLNLVSLSIEHVKTATDNSDTLTAAQQAASFALVKHLCDTWGIPPRKADASGGVTGHYSIDWVDRQHCPGPYPWDELFTYLQGGTPMSGIPQGWTDKATAPDPHLVNPINSYIVRGGFRQKVLTWPWLWPGDDVPLENEHQDGDNTDRVVQTFQYTRLVAVHATGEIFRQNLGNQYLQLALVNGDLQQRLMKDDADLTAAQSQIATQAQTIQTQKTKYAALKQQVLDVGNAA